MTELPVQFGYGGPSILSDGEYVYSAYLINEAAYGDPPNYDVKFTMLDITTYEESVLYREDFPFYSDYGGWPGNPISMVLAYSGVLYYLEYISYPGSYIIQWTLMKVDFNLEEITTLYVSDLITSVNLNNYSPATFMTIIKDTETSTRYLVFDSKIMTDTFPNGLGTKYMLFTEYVRRDEIVPPCENEAEIYGNTYEEAYMVTNSPDRQLYAINIFVFEVESELFLRSYPLYENPYHGFSPYIPNTNYISSANCIPSPIYYDGYLYLTYNFYNEAQFRNVSMYKVQESAEKHCILNPSCIFGPILSEYHAEMWMYTTQFTGALFGIVFKTNPVDGSVTYNELANGRIITILQSNYEYGEIYPVLPDCDEDWPLENQMWIPDEFAQYNNLSMYKMVFDRDTECLYIKAKNPDQVSIFPTIMDIEEMYPAPGHQFTNTSFTDQYQSWGLYKISTNDINDVQLTTYSLGDHNSIYDLFMSKDKAYIYSLDSGYNGIVTEASTGKVVADTGYHYITALQDDTSLDWNNTQPTHSSNHVYHKGMRLSQQASTDENRIWKFQPTVSGGGATPDEFSLIGYSLDGSGPKTISGIVAPFLVDNLQWFNLHQHDGKFILTTSESGYTPPLLGMWLIQ